MHLNRKGCCIDIIDGKGVCWLLLGRREEGVGERFKDGLSFEKRGCWVWLASSSFAKRLFFAFFTFVTTIPSVIYHVHISSSLH